MKLGDVFSARIEKQIKEEEVFFAESSSGKKAVEFQPQILKKRKTTGKESLNDFEQLLSIARQSYFEKYRELPRDIEYREKRPDGNHFICYVDSLYVDRVSKEDFIKHKKHMLKCRTNYNVKFRNLSGTYIIMLLTLKGKGMKPQAGITGFVSGIMDAAQSIMAYKNGVKKIMNGDWKSMMADLVALLLNIREGFLSIPKLLSCILQLYSLDRRFQFMVKQTSTVDLLTMLTVAGFPKHILDALRTFTAMTGKRLFDNDFIMESFSLAVKLIQSVLEHLTTMENSFLGTGGMAFVNKFFNFMTSSVLQYKRIKEVIRLYTNTAKNSSIIHDSTYRQEVIELYKDCISDECFKDYVENASNKNFRVTWNAFVETCYKVCNTYGCSKRSEPVAIVMEGGAGSGKTTLMNTLVDYYGYKGRSVYVHTVPATEAGKDFYDDYKNQDVFVMDDVGQQGVSQWRTLINFVSTTVFPLDCAKAEMKNTKSFNSETILITTNKFEQLSGFTKTDCISEPNALFRRPHLIKVESERLKDGSFAQILTYKKFDHESDRPSWKSEFIGICAGCKIPTTFHSRDYPEKDRNVATLAWVKSVISHVEERTKYDAKKVSLDKDRLAAVDNFELYFDPQCISISCAIQSILNNPISAHAKVWKEWTSYYAHKMTDLASCITTWCLSLVTTCFSSPKEEVNLYGWTRSNNAFVDNLMEGVTCKSVLGVIAISLCAIAACGYFYSSSPEADNMALFLEACDKAKEGTVNWKAQVDSKNHEDDTTRLASVKKAVRLIVMRSDDGAEKDAFSQCVVSGDKVLLPAHAWGKSFFADIYASIEHYRNACKEREDIELKLVKMYPGSDLGVYQIQRCIARYPNCNNLFKESQVKNPALFLVNAYTTIPVLLGVNCVNNDQEVRYGTYVHSKNTGFFHPLTASGACGTILFSEESGIIGYHVAGGDTSGFCVVPPRCVADEIRGLMLHKEDTPYVFDERIEPNRSGARLRYKDGFVTPKRALDETSLIPTVFNIERNEDVKALKATIKDDVIGEISPVRMPIIRDKKPPNFKSEGTAMDMLKKTSAKTFKHQGRIADCEAEFIRKCIDTIIPEFHGIDDETCAFGDGVIPAINKDSSNGYGLLRTKEDYFDFEKREIKQEAKDLFADFYSQVEAGDVDIRKVLSTECYKDETRTEDKVNSPRTFRVMPLNHIWWTKKIFGDVMAYYKDNRMKTGICVGYNPYTDSHELAQKLSKCEVTGDIDFSKWDGSIMARFMYIIGDALKAKYKGPHGKMLDYLISSMATSCVLVGDELHATTHGLPSGTWLTLLMNCLINKCLTALVCIHSADEPSVEAFSRVVDFVMGDDKIIGASGDDALWFNLITLDSTASSLGMTCTNGDKTAIDKDHQEFHNLTFVKRHFRWHPILRRYVGCLSVETLLGTIQWMDKKKDLEDVLPGKMRAVQLEAYLHSKRLYETFTKVFEKYRPRDALFTEDNIRRILDSEDGYQRVLEMMGKDFKYLQ